MTDVYCNLSGARVSKCSLSIPYYGLWTADVELPTDAPIPFQCTLVIADLSLVGAVVRSDSFAGLRTARLVGGLSNGWGRTVSQSEYVNLIGVQSKMVLQDSANAVGERINVSNDTNLGTYFVREAAPAARVLRQLTGDLWYVDVKGVTQAGTPRSTAAISTAFLLEEFDPATGRILASTENPADWQPGRAIANSNLTPPRTLSLVRHHLSNDGILRTEALAA
jgi:hypothetical protein